MVGTQENKKDRHPQDDAANWQTGDSERKGTLFSSGDLMRKGPKGSQEKKWGV